MKFSNDNESPQIFFLVFFIDTNVVTSRLQFMVSQLSKDLEIGGKVKLQSTLFQIVVLDPQERIVEFRVYRLDVFGGQFLVQHALIERQRESRIDESTVIQSLFRKEYQKRKGDLCLCNTEWDLPTSSYHGDETANKLEVVQVIRIDVRRWIDLKAVVILISVFKETVHGI